MYSSGNSLKRERERKVQLKCDVYIWSISHDRTSLLFFNSLPPTYLYLIWEFNAAYVITSTHGFFGINKVSVFHFK